MPQQNQADGASPKDTGGIEGRVRLHNAWARLLQLQGEPQNGLKRRWRAWLLAQELQDVNLMIKTMHNLGLDYSRLGQHEQALNYLQQSKALAIKAGNRKMEGLCYLSIGGRYFHIEQYKEARRYYQMAYHLFTASGNHNWQAHACYNLAEVYAKIGDNAHTQQYFDEGVALADALGDQNLLKLFDNLASISRALVPPTISLNKQKGPRERQRQAFDYIKQHGQISNSQYQKLNRVSASTAYRDLKELVNKRLLVEKGSTRDRCYKLPTR
jgi:tetratricopeptide (TPR) repeat protein